MVKYIKEAGCGKFNLYHFNDNGIITNRIVHNVNRVSPMMTASVFDGWSSEGDGHFLLRWLNFDCGARAWDDTIMEFCKQSFVYVKTL